MKNSKRLIVAASCVMFLAISGTWGYEAFAGEVDKKQLLEQNLALEKAEMEKLQKMPNQTDEEIEAVNEQDRKVKELGLANGELIAEVYPVDPKVELEGKIVTLKDVLIIDEHHYNSNIDDTKRGAAYAKAADSAANKLKTLAQIESDLKENKKSIAQLIEEYEKVWKTTDLIIE